jgi:microcystin-dependent protein
MKMDPFVGEIRIFAGTFAPQGWLFCQGQTLPINQNQVLFAIIGTQFGGNGTINFCLPNLQGRCVMGAGISPSGQSYASGSVGGAESVTLTVANLALHTHVAASPVHTHSVSLPAHDHTFNVPPHTHPFVPACDNVNGPYGTPAGNYPGNSVGSPFYSTSGGQQMAAQATSPNAGTTSGTTAQSAAVSDTSGATAATVTVGPAGSSTPVSTLSPYQVINYIIAITGVFPPRP